LVIFATRLRLIWQPQSCGNPIETLYKETEMKQQANEIRAGLAHEDASELEASLSADLALSETASNEIKAGSVSQTGNVYTVAFGGSLLGHNDLGGSLANHNETVAEDEATTSEALTDLPVEDAEQVKGGPSGLSAGKVHYSDLSVMY
jgi:hypothetical protein